MSSIRNIPTGLIRRLSVSCKIRRAVAVSSHRWSQQQHSAFSCSTTQPTLCTQQRLAYFSPHLTRCFSSSDTTDEDEIPHVASSSDVSVVVADDDATSMDDPNDFSRMSNEELADASTIPGWDLVHNPPRTYPRGALIGTVVSTKMQKTVNVAVTRYRVPVPKIGKKFRYTKKFMAHDEKEVAEEGDLVMITPCQRISKNKHFMLREIIRHKGKVYL